MERCVRTSETGKIKKTCHFLSPGGPPKKCLLLCASYLRDHNANEAFEDSWNYQPHWMPKWSGRPLFWQARHPKSKPSPAQNPKSKNDDFLWENWAGGWTGLPLSTASLIIFLVSFSLNLFFLKDTTYFMEFRASLPRWMVSMRLRLQRAPP